MFVSDVKELPSLKLENYIFRIELENLKPEVEEIARKELRETPEVRRDAIVALRDLLKGNIPTIVILTHCIFSK